MAMSVCIPHSRNYVASEYVLGGMTTILCSRKKAGGFNTILCSHKKSLLPRNQYPQLLRKPNQPIPLNCTPHSFHSNLAKNILKVYFNKEPLNLQLALRLQVWTMDRYHSPTKKWSCVKSTHMYTRTYTPTHTQLTSVDSFLMLIYVDHCLLFCYNPHWLPVACLFGCSNCCLTSCDFRWSATPAWNQQPCLHLDLFLAEGKAKLLMHWLLVQNPLCVDPPLTAVVCWSLPGRGQVEVEYVVGVSAVAVAAAVVVAVAVPLAS